MSTCVCSLPQALSFLYQQGFPPLGHVHTGNLYVGVAEGGKEVCRLGGYESRLLGYRTFQNAFMYQKYGDAIDLIMFGKHNAWTCPAVEVHS